MNEKGGIEDEEFEKFINSIVPIFPGLGEG